MTPVVKSSGVRRARSYKTSPEQRRAAALARVEIYEINSTGSRLARGRLDQLIDAGYVPTGIAVDKVARQSVEWSDLDGRQAVLRPYARHQWEVRILRLPHEVEEAKRLEIERQRAYRQRCERDKEHDEKRRALSRQIEYFPTSLAQFRHKAWVLANHALDCLERQISGGFDEGCDIDEDSLDEIRASMAAIKATLSAATYRYDPQVLPRLRAELKAFDARNDDQLQAMLRQVGAK